MLSRNPQFLWGALAACVIALHAASMVPEQTLEGGDEICRLTLMGVGHVSLIGILLHLFHADGC